MKKAYNELYLEILSFGEDVVLASERGEGWKPSWNDVGDSGYSAGN